MAQFRVELYNAKVALEDHLAARAAVKAYNTPGRIYKPAGGLAGVQKREADTLAALELALSNVLELATSAGLGLRLKTDCPQLATIWLMHEGKGDAFVYSQLEADRALRRALRPAQVQKPLLILRGENVEDVRKWVVRAIWNRANFDPDESPSEGNWPTWYEDIPFEDVHCTGLQNCTCMQNAVNSKLGESRSQVTGLFELAAAPPAAAAASGAPPAAGGAAAAASAP